MSPAEIAIIVNQAAAKHGVSPEALMTIANIESSGNVNAQNPRSSASGLFQFVDKTAREYGLTGSRRNDPVAQADAAAKMMATNQSALSRTLGRQPTPGELYLAHQQGLTGATALLRNPNRPAVDVLAQVYGSREKAQNAVRLNGGNLNQSAGQFSGQWVNKANQRASLIPPAAIPNVVASRLDVTPPQVPATRASTPTSAASRAAPSFAVTPRLAPGNSDIYSYHIPDMTPTAVVGGLGSLTPDRAPPPLPRLDPRVPNRMDMAAPVRLPPLPPPIPSSVVNKSIANAQAATNPVVAAALARSAIPAGMAMNTRSRDSVAQANMGAAFTHRGAIHGPASPPKSQARLTPGIYPQTPGGVPSVASALSVMPPMPRPRPAIAPRPAVTGFPTPLSQRPAQQPVIGFPTPAQQRPIQSAAARPSPSLQVTVQGANSYSEPQTITGSSTGRSYNVGQQYQAGGYVFEATPSGFKQIGRVR